jgi:hypothetical protein
MGTILESFDQQIMPYRNSLTYTMNQGNYQMATFYVECMHNTIPPKARLEDFTSFKLQKNIWNYQDKVNKLAFEYCRYWTPKVESSIAVYRDLLINQSMS